MKKKILIAVFAALASAAPAAAQDAFAQKEYDLASSSPAVRAAAIAYFKDQRSAEADGALLRRLDGEKNPAVRVQLVEALNVNASTEAFAYAAASLYDRNPAVAHASALALGRCGDSEKLVAVFEKAVKDRSVAPRVKQAIVNELGFHSTASSVRVLDYVAANTGNPGEMRQLAVSSMARIGTKEAADRIKLYRNDKDPRVKGEAQKAAVPKKK